LIVRFHLGGGNDKAVPIQQQGRHSHRVRPEVLLVKNLDNLMGFLVQVEQSAARQPGDPAFPGPTDWYRYPWRKGC
jgi:hypothetical protein